jgi:hypothetical protein
VVRGIPNLKDAQAALRRQLEKLIKVKKSTEKDFAFNGQPIQSTTTQKAGRELSQNRPRTSVVP